MWKGCRQGCGHFWFSLSLSGTCPSNKFFRFFSFFPFLWLTEGVLISCTSSKLSACESTDSRLFGVEEDDNERGFSIELTLFLDGIFDPSGLSSWKETVRKKQSKA